MLCSCLGRGLLCYLPARVALPGLLADVAAATGGWLASAGYYAAL